MDREPRAPEGGADSSLLDSQPLGQDQLLEKGQTSDRPGRAQQSQGRQAPVTPHIAPSVTCVGSKDAEPQNAVRTAP